VFIPMVRRSMRIKKVLLLLCQPRLACNQYRSKTQFDPCISSVTSSIMITSSNSSVKRSGLPIQLLDVVVHTIVISELARVRTEFFGGW
jgi:hypothetical protein